MSRMNVTFCLDSQKWAAFYNTGIATYIWVLSNRKTSERKSKVQLINASGWYAPLRKTAKPVVKKVHKPGKVEASPLYGKFAVKIDGKPCVVEYEPDSNLRDTEQVRLLDEDGIEAFFQQEGLPYMSDAGIDAEKIQVGYEISFTRHFYEPTPLCTLEEIRADIIALEQETEGLLEDIVKVE